MIYFIGAGPGAVDLITVRGKEILEKADVIIYAGSLVNPLLLEYKKDSCEVYDSAKMTLEEVIEVMLASDGEDKIIVRLHTGDPYNLVKMTVLLVKASKIQGFDHFFYPKIVIFEYAFLKLY